MSTISIIILNYNDFETTNLMINKIKDYKVINHIIVVDNCSTDNSFKELSKIKDIDVIKTNSNHGYAAGNNFGIKYDESKYKSDYLIISNPDISVEEIDIENLKKDLDEHASVAVVAPRVHEFDNVSRGWKLPTYGAELATISNTKQRFFKRVSLYEDSYYSNALTSVDAVSGSFFIIRSSVLKAIDYFDEGTFLYYEENILGFKLKEKEYLTYIDNNVDVIHNLSVSVDKSIRRINKYKILVHSLMYYESKYNKVNIFGKLLLYIVYGISLLLAYIIGIFRKLGK